MACPRPRAVISCIEPSFALEPALTLPHHCAGAQKIVPVAIIGSRGYSQHHNLPYKPPPRNSSPSPPGDKAYAFEDNMQVVDTDVSMLIYCTPDRENGTISWTWRRQATQWKWWQEEFIPMAIQPYMSLCKTTESLRLNPTHLDRYDCKCEQGHVLQIKVVRFSAVEEITLCWCNIHPVGRQLIQRGLFPCALVIPLLPVDMKVLEFARTLFLRVSPNVTAVSYTLEDCLISMGHKPDTMVCAGSDSNKWRITQSI